ncbi:flagellar hook-basal body complex protein FliE [Romboutsia weinsteinii]|uniref:Flagellar hook-basal body complex protein FliE n=1 Tax=Romboutsia weinsteinii TaxID=2020949 RepID=A0A255INV6_9FIRM|nr:flagellar hook-basal body complex protein FliE [Romboutsia weinsteinii]
MSVNTEAINKGLESINYNNINVHNKNEENKNNKFSEIISGVINNVNNSQVNANNMVNSFIKGEDVSMHNVMLAVEESQISMQLLIEMRNKLVEAYQEVNKVQL